MKELRPWLGGGNCGALFPLVPETHFCVIVIPGLVPKTLRLATDRGVKKIPVHLWSSEGIFEEIIPSFSFTSHKLPRAVIPLMHVILSIQIAVKIVQSTSQKLLHLVMMINFERSSMKNQISPAWKVCGRWFLQLWAHVEMTLKIPGTVVLLWSFQIKLLNAFGL